MGQACFFSSSLGAGRFKGCDDHFRHRDHPFFLEGPADELQPDRKAVEQFRVVWSARDYYF